VKNGNIQIILRLNHGVLTRRISVPPTCKLKFCLPVRCQPGLVRNLSDIPTGLPYMEFRWDGKSTEGSDHCPILDLVEVSA
jgi:hypothetical protein